MDNLIINVALNILKPADQVYEAIVDPGKMNGYFIAWGSARMETGKTVEWKFPEMDLQFPVKVLTAQANETISFMWDAEDGESTKVEIVLIERGQETFVKISEGSKAPDPGSLKWFKQNTEGWANFLCCLKAYLEYGINLRKGAF